MIKVQTLRLERFQIGKEQIKSTKEMTREGGMC